MVVLRWERISLIGGNFIATGLAPVDARIQAVLAGLVRGVVSLTITLIKVLCVLVLGHVISLDRCSRSDGQKVGGNRYPVDRNPRCPHLPPRQYGAPAFLGPVEADILPLHCGRQVVANLAKDRERYGDMFRDSAL